ncbi:MAG TPA: hypothetical protein VMA09_17325 [Candidatus Binataceae bacterium]|nr:hypothetical protein [Candidatus Binataceae bacterium]
MQSPYWKAQPPIALDNCEPQMTGVSFEFFASAGRISQYGTVRLMSVSYMQHWKLEAASPTQYVYC